MTQVVWTSEVKAKVKRKRKSLVKKKIKK